MLHNSVIVIRTRGHLAIAALAFSAAVFLCLGAGVSWAETTTTGVGDVTVTTSGDATAPPDEAATTTTAAPAAEGLTPAAPGFEAPNPGLLAAQMGVQFWPEYDTNDVLVLLDVTLPATTVFPYEFTFYVPKGARLAGIAEIDENGNFDYTLGTPLITTGELMDSVTVTVPSRTVLRLEYYYDPGVGTPGAKSYTLAFQVPADVGQLSVGVQQPLGSSGFSAGTSLSQTTSDAQGFNYSFGTFSGVKAGDLIQIPVAYTRSEADPSVSPGDTGSDPAQQQNSNYLLWLLLVLVLAIGGIAAYRLFFRREPAPARGRAASAGSARKPASAKGSGGRKASQSGAGKARAGDTGGGPVRFCTQCGGRLGKKDRFCPQCGIERES